MIDIEWDNKYSVGHSGIDHEHQVLLSKFDEHLHNYIDGVRKLDQVVDFMFEWFALHTTTVDRK